jgi:hypothetical protein
MIKYNCAYIKKGGYVRGNRFSIKYITDVMAILNNLCQVNKFFPTRQIRALISKTVSKIRIKPSHSATQIDHQVVRN